MRVLVATHHTNGQVAGDYDHCVDGELVYMQDPCDSDLRDPDGGCGCGRGFAGMSSHRASTTAMVVDRPLGPEDLREALRSSLEAGGWLDPAFCPPDLAVEVVEGLAAEVRALAEHFPLGSIVRRRLDRYTATRVPG